MRPKRPIIGITGPDKGGLSAWLFTSFAVRRAGGRPVRIRPAKPHGVDGLDGLIVGGGADVSPSLYGQERLPRVGSLEDRGARGWRRALGLILFPLVFVIRRLLTTKTGGLDEGRDRLEKRLVREAGERGLPMLGICRGMQLINVVGGGSLHQSLRDFYDEVPAIRTALPRKTVNIVSESRLAEALGATRALVNALHSQAIERLGDGMWVCAREENGIVQAIEHTAARFVVGVQWHPEYLPQRPEQRGLFRALVEAASLTGSRERERRGGRRCADEAHA